MTSTRQPTLAITDEEALILKPLKKTNPLVTLYQRFSTAAQEKSNDSADTNQHAEQSPTLPKKASKLRVGAAALALFLLYTAWVMALTVTINWSTRTLDKPGTSPFSTLLLVGGILFSAGLGILSHRLADMSFSLITNDPQRNYEANMALLNKFIEKLEKNNLLTSEKATNSPLTLFQPSQAIAKMVATEMVATEKTRFLKK